MILPIEYLMSGTFACLNKIWAVVYILYCFMDIRWIMYDLV